MADQGENEENLGQTALMVEGPGSSNPKPLEDAVHGSSTAAEMVPKREVEDPEGPYAHLSPSDHKKVVALATKKSELQSTIRQMQAEKEELSMNLVEQDVNLTIKNHIKLLHKYNEVKDIAMGLLGMIAEQRGVPIKEVMKEFDLDKKD